MCKFKLFIPCVKYTLSCHKGISPPPPTCQNSICFRPLQLQSPDIRDLILEGGLSGPCPAEPVAQPLVELPQQGQEPCLQSCPSWPGCCLQAGSCSGAIPAPCTPWSWVRHNRYSPWGSTESTRTPHNQEDHPNVQAENLRQHFN